MRIVTLFVRHGTAAYPTALAELYSFFSRCLPDVHWELLLIDNSLPNEYYQSLSDQCTVIGGANSHWEFSAWDSGIRHLGKRLYRYDFVHLVTSAFNTLYTRFLERIDARTLELIRGRGAAVGHIDYYDKPVYMFGRNSSAWLRSSFVFLPPAEVALLDSFVGVQERDILFSDNPSSPFKRESPLSFRYQRYLIDWLTGAGTGQGIEWHSRFVLSSETFPRFRQKVLAIVNEHMLSVRLRAQGCAMVDATWLATRAKALDSRVFSIGLIPPWRAQVSQRDIDAAPSAVISVSAANLLID